MTKNSLLIAVIILAVLMCVVLTLPGRAIGDEMCSFWEASAEPPSGRLWTPPLKSEACTKLISENLEMTIDAIFSTEGVFLEAGENGLVKVRLVNMSDYYIYLPLSEEYVYEWQLDDKQEMSMPSDNGRPSFEVATIKYTFLNDKGIVVLEDVVVVGYPRSWWMFENKTIVGVFSIKAPEKKGTYDVRFLFDNINVKDAIVSFRGNGKIPHHTNIEKLVDVYFRKEVLVKGIPVK